MTAEMMTATMMVAGMTTTDPMGGSGAGREKVGPPTPGRWRVIFIAVGGLLAGVAVACIVALALTLTVREVVDQALRNDIELEDEGDDLRAAVLDMRHYHRNIVFTGPTRAGLGDFEQAYGRLLEEIDELELVRIESSDVAQAWQLRERVRAYYAAYRPAIELYETDRATFDAASDAGLAAIASLGEAAEELEGLGEQLSETALGDVEGATSTATLILLAVLIGVGLTGLGLAAVAVRVLRELRALYASQEEVTAQLALALRARTDFIADASHELRTPLTVLRGNAEVGLAAGVSDPELEQILREIVAESERMTLLVEDLLLLARFDAGSLPLEAREVELELWLAEVAARGEMLARERHVTLMTSLQAVGQARIDARRLEQAVMVLLDNATKYSPTGSPVRLAARRAGSSLVIEVVDRGPGISADVLPFIFERFNRGDRHHDGRRSGAGLGLSIARAIASAHGGDIVVVSHDGQGTRMALTVPLAGSAAMLTLPPLRPAGL
jgi:signal transduction histidine kinase